MLEFDIEWPVVFFACKQKQRHLEQSKVFHVGFSSKEKSCFFTVLC